MASRDDSAAATVSAALDAPLDAPLDASLDATAASESASNQTPTTANAETTEPEAPDQAGERLASHLDMLAETVRAIVTRVMQPQAASPCVSDDEGQTNTNTEGPLNPPLTNAATVSANGRTEYSLDVREQCVAKHAAGASYKTIATDMGMPITTVQTIVKRAKQAGGMVLAAQRAGRPRVTDESVERTIREIVAAQPRLSAREVLDQVMLAHDGLAVSFETIRRRVRDCRKQLSGETVAPPAPPPPAPLTLQEQLRAGLQQQQAQLQELEDEQDDDDVDNGIEVDGDVNSDQDGNAGPGNSAATDTDADTTTATATSRRPVAAGKAKARRKRGSEYSPEFRELCVLKHERDGQSYQAIATELDIPPDSVRAIVRKAKRTGSVVTAPRSGRPRKTTDLIDRVILQSVKNSQRSTAKQIQDDLWSIYQVKVSCETIRRRVRDHTKQRLQLVDATAVPPAPNMMAVPMPVSFEAPETSPDATTTPSNTEEETPPPAAPATRSLKRKRAEYPLDVREKCVALHSEGLGFRKIGEQLNMPHTTVRAIVEKVQRTGSMLPAPRSGRPRKTDEILDKVILQTVKANAKCSARMIQHELETAFDVKVSCETIRRRVKDYMRQKHLFPEATPLAIVLSDDDEAMAARRPVAVEMPAALLADQLELERQQQQAAADEHARRRQQEEAQAAAAVAAQQQEQHESMLLMAEITQPFHNVTNMTNDVRSVPPSLLEMMTAAAAVTTPHDVYHHHQPLPLMPVPYGFAFAPALHHHQPHHAQAMQAMLDEALGTTQPLEPAPHPHGLQQAPPSTGSMNEFVLL